MSLPAGVGFSAAAVGLKRTRRREHWFFIVLSALILTVVFAGFMRTYYLRGIFGSPLLEDFLQVHGAVMSTWIALLLIQVVLIISNRVEWHRRLGTAGIAVAILVFAMGAAATLRAAAREVAAHSDSVNDQLEILALELTQVILFGLLFSLAIWHTKQPAIHKRLMVLATLCILPNPIVRIFLNFHVSSNFTFLLIWSFVVVAVVLVDCWRSRHIYRHFALWACVAITAMFLAYFAGQSAPWLRLSAALVS